MSQLLMRRPLDHPFERHHLARRASPEDAGGIARLLSESFAEEWDADRVERSLFGEAANRCTFVIDDGGEIVATATARYDDEAFPGMGYVHMVASDPRHRGRRLGRVVTEAVLEVFVADGRAFAVLETDDWRVPAIRTYLGMGFVPVPRDESHFVRWAALLAEVYGRRTESAGVSRGAEQ